MQTQHDSGRCLGVNLDGITKWKQKSVVILTTLLIVASNTCCSATVSGTVNCLPMQLFAEVKSCRRGFSNLMPGVQTIRDPFSPIQHADWTQ